MRSNLRGCNELFYITIYAKKQGNLIEICWGGEHDLNKNPSIKKHFLNNRRAQGLKGQCPFLFENEYRIFGCNAEMA